jgi:hypothetical protein
MIDKEQGGEDMSYVWQEARTNPVVPKEQCKGIKFAISAQKQILENLKSGEHKYVGMVHETDRQYYAGVVMMLIEANGTLWGHIGYWPPQGGYINAKNVVLNWNEVYKLYLVRNRDPRTGFIYLNMYIMRYNEEIIASESIPVNTEANKPYIMTELRADSKPFENKFKLGNIFEIDLVKLDGQIHRWKYADGVNIEPHLEEEKDDIIYTTKYNRYGDMMFETGWNI